MNTINHHFRREARIMLGVVLFVVALGLLIGLLMPHLFAFMAEDKCLDSGGRYDTQQHTCEPAPPAQP
ncbi:hypothetical protein [Halioxenophilus sp. WMMB6]|uniref:hypothetical protein n=1 Tax=Halioxenophilus sp. WMMB6 TaxID=3073815 RepID=UPI00295F1038|nr:hypothetical protein [Halioxenophilus sp. WMMB6]